MTTYFWHRPTTRPLPRWLFALCCAGLPFLAAYALVRRK